MRALALLVSLGLLLALGTGCARVHDQLTGATVDSVVSSPADDVLRVVDWSVEGGLVSVVVRNVRDHTLETADVTLVGSSSSGAEVGAWPGSTPLTSGGCCQIAALAPGETFGLSFAVGAPAASITAIRLDYQNMSWSSAPVHPSPISAVLRGGGLASDHTVVLATVRNHGPLAPTVLVQAVLRGRSGHLYAVATDRWSCLAPGADRDVQLSLFQPVPRGVRVASIVARPLTEGARPDCSATSG